MISLGAAMLGGTLGAGALGFLGQRSANRTNRGIASARNAFEEEEALKAREFSARGS